MAWTPIAFRFSVQFGRGVGYFVTITNLIFGFLPNKIGVGYFSSQRDMILGLLLIEFHTEISIRGPRITRVGYFDSL